MYLSKLLSFPFVERLLRLIPDRLYVSLLYFKNVGKLPNLSKPITFTEKLQWLKLNYHKPEFCVMVDKYAVKDYVANKIGTEFIVPTLAVWKELKQIDIAELPNQFVLKWNHDSGSIVVCKDKSLFDLEIAVKKLSKGAHKNGFWYGREWPYKSVVPCIIAEKYIEDSTHAGNLTDYKFYCFNGEPRYCQVIRDRYTNETIDFYDMDWNHQPFVGLNHKARNGKVPVERPSNFEKVKEVCRVLSEGIPFVRIDLYIVEDHVYFGEITFYPASGFGVFTPKEWDKKLGDLIII